MDPETGIPVKISRTYSGIVPFRKLEVVPEYVPETGKIPEHVLESGKISPHIPEIGKIPKHVPETGIIPETGKFPEHVPETGKIPEQTHSGNRKTFRNTFRKLENFRNIQKRNKKFTLYSILDVVRD